MDIGPLPYVRHSARQHGFPVLWECFRALPHEPLRVTAHLATTYAPADGERLHLDGPLANALVRAYPVPVHYGERQCVIPLPLLCLAVYSADDGARLPLWACSDLIPAHPERRTVYWHKRYPDDRYVPAARRVSTTTGDAKEMRIPMPTISAPTLSALVIGHREALELLLPHITHLGKKRAFGQGRVLYWRVTPVRLSVEEAVARIVAERAVPTAYFDAPDPSRVRARAGWCQNRWYRPWQTACVVP